MHTTNTNHHTDDASTTAPGRRYRTILAADAARVRMLGLTIKAGADDA